MTQGANVSPATRHSLCAAWQFTDAFSLRPIAVPLTVTVPAIAPPYPWMPALPWTAVDGGDGVYRFKVTNGVVAPTGTLAVNVAVPTSDYVAFEPLAMTLVPTGMHGVAPRPLAGPYPQRSDFLLSTPLWPTRVFRIPPGETAVVGSITNAASAPVAGLKVTMWSSAYANAPAGTPYTYTDANGDFVFRLLGPDFRVDIAGGHATTTVGVSISLLAPPAHTTAVIPTTPFPQTIPLGQVTTMPIRVP